MSDGLATTVSPAAAGTAPAVRRPSAARERILEAADRLFYDEGIHAVGIQRVIAEAGVTRVTLYRHFPSKDDLVTAYLARRAQYDRDQVSGIIAAHRDDPRAALEELATALTRDDFAAMRRGCPFINASAEFIGTHPARLAAYDIRHWVIEQIEGLLSRLGHAAPHSTAVQLMMVRTGAVVSGALDSEPALNESFLTAWNALVDDGLTP